MRIAVVLLLLGVQTTGFAQGADDAPDYRNALDQGRFFIKKGWLEDAREQLFQASKDPNGRLDPEVWYLLAHIAFQQCDIAATREAISAAHTNARNTNQLTQIAHLERTVSQPIGWVRLPKRSHTKTPLTALTPIFQPAFKDYLKRVQEKLQNTQVLPDPIGLPAGHYRLGDWSFEIVPDETVSHPDVREVKPVTGGIYLRLGVGHRAGRQFQHLSADLQIDTGITIQWRHLHIEGGLQYTPQAYETHEQRSMWQWDAWGGRIAAGYRTNGSSWGADVLVGYRLGVLAPVQLPCVTTADDGLTCGYTQSAEHTIYPRSVSHMIHIILRVRKDIDNWTIGASLSPELSLGRLQKTGASSKLAQDEFIQYAVESDSRLWRSIGGRFSVYIQRNF